MTGPRTTPLRPPMAEPVTPTAVLRTGLYRALIVLSIFNGLSALGGGVGMMVADGLSMPKSLLADSPFSTYLIPGAILAVVVGGSQALASVFLIARHESALLMSAVAGFGLVIWILIEIGIIHEFSWLQLVYVVTGLVQLVLVFALLGIVSWLPRERQSDRPSRTTAPASGR
jgi:hypothetical protein